MVEPKIESKASFALTAGTDSLPFGPWKTLYSGAWAGHKSSVFVNDERVLLLLVHEEAPLQGALVLLKKIFVLDGDSRELIAFLNSQKRSFSVVEKIGRTGRTKFLILDGESTYAADVVRDFGDVLRSQYSALSGVSKSLLEIAESYKADITELSKASFDAADALLGDPLLLAASKPDEIGIRGARSAAGRGRAAERAIEGASERSSLIGLNSNREPFEVSVDSLKRVTILSKDAAQAGHLQQVLAEAALLNGVSCLVFTSSGASSGGASSIKGLCEASDSRDDFDYFRMQSEAHGFPVK